MLHCIKYVYLCKNTVLSLENEIELLTNYFNFTSELSQNQSCFQRPLKFEVFRNCHRNVHTVLSLSQFCLIIVSSSNLIKNVPKELIGKKTSSVFYILTYLLTVRTAINFHPKRNDFYPSLWMESDITTHHWVFENSSFCVLRIFVSHEYLLTQ